MVSEVIALINTAPAEISFAIFASIEYLLPKYASTTNSITVFISSAKSIKPVVMAKIAISKDENFSKMAAIMAPAPIIRSILKFL